MLPPHNLSSIHEILIKYTLLPSIPLSIIAILSANHALWVSSGVHHFYFEAIAVILTSIVAFYCITRAYILNDKFSLFIGIGYAASALINLMHAVVFFIDPNQPEFLTWSAGRTFLSAMMVIAIIKFGSISSGQKQEQLFSFKETSKIFESYVTIPIVIILILLAVSLSVVSFYTFFPGIILSGNMIARPYEFPSLILFSIALMSFYKKGLFQYNDIFYKGIIASLLLDIFAQIVMSYAFSPFETAHNVSHILKDASFFVIIISLSLSSIQYNKIAKEREQVIRAQYDELKEANRNLIEREELIRHQYEKLKESDKMKDEFINVAAHELRTPIQPILALTHALRSRIKDDDQLSLVDTMSRNASRLSHLTEDILDVTRIESRSLNLNKDHFNLKDIIVNCINDVTSNRFFYEHKDIFIEADKGRMSQVISNLLNNAIKFTKGEGRVSISSEKNDSDVIVSIKDTGEGIDPDILPKLFSKFVSKSFQGTGLGLFISKSIVEAHGGKIWAENNSDGKGATFTFTLPISQQ